eukprot:gene12632-biopygen10555
MLQNKALNGVPKSRDAVATATPLAAPQRQSIYQNVTAAIPLPSARVSRHVNPSPASGITRPPHDEMTVLQRDLDLMFREVPELHEFNRALQVRATAVETAKRVAVSRTTQWTHLYATTYCFWSAETFYSNLPLQGTEPATVYRTYSLYSNSYPYPWIVATQATRLYPPVPGFGLPLDATWKQYYSVSSTLASAYNPDKSCFALDAVDFLGFDVSNHGLTPQAAKVQAIKDMPYPSNLKDLKDHPGSKSSTRPRQTVGYTDLRLAAMVQGH